MLKNCLREVRQSQKLTQEQLAQSVNLTRQTIIAIEKGRFTPSVYTALRLSEALGMVVEKLFWIDKNLR